MARGFQVDGSDAEERMQSWRFSLGEPAKAGNVSYKRRYIERKKETQEQK